MNQYYTYILFSPVYKKFYIGQTQNFSNRIAYHNSGRVKSTKAYLPWEKVLVLDKESRSAAMMLEKKLKNLNREKLLGFIEKYR